MTRVVEPGRTPDQILAAEDAAHAAAWYGQTTFLCPHCTATFAVEPTDFRTQHRGGHMVAATSDYGRILWAYCPNCKKRWRFDRQMARWVAPVAGLITLAIVVIVSLALTHYGVWR